MGHSVRNILILAVIFAVGPGRFDSAWFESSSVGIVSAEEPPTAGLSPKQTSQLAQLMELDWQDRPEWAEMAVMILKGAPMKTGTGWFTPSNRRHDWDWLASRLPEAAKDDQITPDEFPQLTKEEFARVDRDADRVISPNDFRFEKNPFMEDDSPASSIFSRLDDDSNGRVTMKELERWFKKSSDDTAFLSVDDLKDALGLGPRPPRKKSAAGRPRKDPRWEMLGMLLNGEMGSFSEGPSLNDDAPELDLPLVAHKAEGGGLELTDRMIRLEDFEKRKPIVLIFGSFT
jgi:hypothetical protein